ncbi:hypothetical protein J6590_061053 [Homalodisca vitripennis]|nr:hypothetical protein J6590_061053 [Homalodisca vitripennis]
MPRAPKCLGELIASTGMIEVPLAQFAVGCERLWPRPCLPNTDCFVYLVTGLQLLTITTPVECESHWVLYQAVELKLSFARRCSFNDTLRLCLEFVAPIHPRRGIRISEVTI